MQSLEKRTLRALRRRYYFLEGVVILRYDVQFTHAVSSDVVLFRIAWLGVECFDISLSISNAPHFSVMR